MDQAPYSLDEVRRLAVPTRPFYVAHPPGLCLLLFCCSFAAGFDGGRESTIAGAPVEQADARPVRMFSTGGAGKAGSLPGKTLIARGIGKRGGP
jgi:hypothetical protein